MNLGGIASSTRSLPSLRQIRCPFLFMHIMCDSSPLSHKCSIRIPLLNLIFHLWHKSFEKSFSMSVNTGILGLSARWCTYDLGVLNGIKSSHISGGVRRCLQGKYRIPMPKFSCCFIPGNVGSLGHFPYTVFFQWEVLQPWPWHMSAFKMLGEFPIFSWGYMIIALS
jgi:hypothetical protein